MHNYKRIECDRCKFICTVHTDQEPDGYVCGRCIGKERTDKVLKSINYRDRVLDCCYLCQHATTYDGCECEWHNIYVSALGVCDDFK